eukprot:6762147-Heterocapsa_arctica.AAC.1
MTGWPGPGNHPGRNRAGAWANAMEQLTTARQEVEHARETVRRLADAVRFTQAAETEALKN